MTFWYRWPSWLTELVAGLLLATVVQLARALVGAGLVWQFLGALAGSLFYETFLDENAGKLGHNPLRDVAQRTVGIVAGLALWWLALR